MKIKFYFYFLAIAEIIYCVKSQNVGNERISQIKCNEYAKLAEKVTLYTSLSLDSTVQDLKKEYCDISAGLIVDGVKANPNEFPHMTAIGYRDMNGEINFICGGSLISERFVMTAAHCSRNDQFKATIVRLGTLKLKSSERRSPAKDYEIQTFIVHEDYDPQTKQNDIALVKLKEAVDLSNSQRIRPACLWQSDKFNQDYAIATGWGALQNQGEGSNELMKVKLDLLDSDACQSLLGSSISIGAGQFCAGLSGKRDTCQGDSGGPVQVVLPKNKCVSFVIGVTSFGDQCGTSTSPSVYTRVSFYLDWIEARVWA